MQSLRAVITQGDFHRKSVPIRQRKSQYISTSLDPMQATHPRSSTSTRAKTKSRATESQLTICWSRSSKQLWNEKNIRTIYLGQLGNRSQYAIYIHILNLYIYIIYINIQYPNVMSIVIIHRPVTSSPVAGSLFVRNLIVNLRQYMLFDKPKSRTPNSLEVRWKFNLRFHVQQKSFHAGSNQKLISCVCSVATANV